MSCKRWRSPREVTADPSTLGSCRVSLKKVIDQTDLETLLSEVRRKVEWDLGGDGIPRPHSSVVPPLDAHRSVPGG